LIDPSRRKKMGKRNTIEKCNANTLARTRFFCH
jgi:hypothetical protein